MISRRLAARSGPIASTLGRIGIRVEIDDREGVFDGVADGSIVDAVLARDPMDFHIVIS